MEKTIKVNEKVHKRLGRLGSTNESFQDVIVKLMDFWEAKNKK